MKEFLAMMLRVVCAIIVAQGPLTLPLLAAQNVQTVNGVAIANVATVNGVAIANVGSIGGVDNTAGGSFTYYSTAFDGTNDYCDRVADFTGISDGQTGLFSCWVKMDTSSSDTGFYEFLTFGNFNFRVSRRNAGEVLIRCRNTATTEVMEIKSNNNSCIKASGWTHILASWDTGTAGRRHIYVNGSDQTTQVVFTAGSTIDYTWTGVEVGAGSGGQQKFPGLMCELYFTTPAAWFDITNSTNRDKFFNSGNSKPVDLGADGSTPTGTQPILYLRNPFSSFETNLGSGGNFTVVGALGDGGADIP